ncbi:hypothetical protein PG995_003653 [Apiospora arundinis]
MLPVVRHQLFLGVQVFRVFHCEIERTLPTNTSEALSEIPRSQARDAPIPLWSCATKEFKLPKAERVLGHKIASTELRLASIPFVVRNKSRETAHWYLSVQKLGVPFLYLHQNTEQYSHSQDPASVIVTKQSHEAPKGIVAPNLANKAG